MWLLIMTMWFDGAAIHTLKFESEQQCVKVGEAWRHSLTEGRVRYYSNFTCVHFRRVDNE